MNNIVERINIIYDTYLEDITQNYIFTNISWSDEGINSYIQVMLQRDELNNAGLVNLTIDRMRRNEELKEKTKKSYIDIVYEKAYTQICQHFEIFIGENLKILNYVNEGLLNSNSFNSRQTKKKYIDNAVKNIIQSKNIVDVIEILEKNLGEKFVISDDEKMKIYEIANNRNIIIHNSAIINSIYIKKLKNKKIISKYKVGECISKDLRDLFNIDIDILNSVCKKIFETMIKKYRNE